MPLVLLTAPPAAARRPRLVEGDREALAGVRRLAPAAHHRRARRPPRLDLFLFYVFWEVMLVPMYLLIGIWGGERRIYAAVKFFLFTMAGSLLMLIAILWMALAPSRADRRRLELRLRRPAAARPAAAASRSGSSRAFALAFAIKVPMFPLHTWLPDAHVEAPTGGSVILAGIMLKLGTYGFLRFALPLFPHASEAARPLLVALRDDRHPLRRAGRLGADGHEEAGRLLLHLGVIFFALLIAGLIVNTSFLVREIRRNEQHDSFINAVTHDLENSHCLYTPLSPNLAAPRCG